MSTGRPASRKRRLDVQIIEMKSTETILWRVEGGSSGHIGLCKPVLI
jgi:hypothetical protein